MLSSWCMHACPRPRCASTKAIATTPNQQQLLEREPRQAHGLIEGSGPRLWIALRPATKRRAQPERRAINGRSYGSRSYLVDGRANPG